MEGGVRLYFMNFAWFQGMIYSFSSLDSTQKMWKHMYPFLTYFDVSPTLIVACNWDYTLIEVPYFSRSFLRPGIKIWSAVRSGHRTAASQATAETATGGDESDTWLAIAGDFDSWGGLFFVNTVDPRNPAPVDISSIYRVLYIPGGAGFLPSTVSFILASAMLQVSWSIGFASAPCEEARWQNWKVGNHILFVSSYRCIYQLLPSDPWSPKWNPLTTWKGH